MAEWHITHGHTIGKDSGGRRSSTYRSWDSMRDRCQRDARYVRRGIVVCDRWQRSFVDFLADMGERPEGTSIERIDNAGNYEPGNCRWATAQEQSSNRKSSVMITREGRTQTLKQWATELGVDYFRAWRRIKRLGWTAERALTEPAQQQGS